MTDREKVIKAIEICYSGKHNCTECDLFYVEDCKDKLMRDVLELLKEQETIVRCKDCRYLNEDCGICIIGIAHGNRDTWFCAYGKRRDEME